MSSYLIWIPSLQDYRRFEEMTTTHQLMLLKSSNELEFIYNINTLIFSLCVDTINFQSLTLIDKYIIALYLRMYSIGTDIEFSLNCPKCGVEFSTKVDLNDVIENNVSVLDRPYEQEIISGKYSIICDIPTCGRDYNILKLKSSLDIQENSVESLFTFNLFSHIKKLKISGKLIDLSKYTLEEVIQICKELPMSVIQDMQTKFMIPLSKTFIPKLLNVPCQTEKCPPFEYNLNVQNINEAIQLLYSGSPITIMQEIYYLSKYANMSAEFLNTVSPKEREMFLKFLIDDKKEEREHMNNQNSNSMQLGDIDMTSHGFDLPESPSEFK